MHEVVRNRTNWDKDELLRQINHGFHIACRVVRTTVDVDSQYQDPIMSDRNVLVVHMTQRVSRFCNYRHGCPHGSCLGRFIHCANALIAIFDKMFTFSTNETLAV